MFPFSVQTIAELKDTPGLAAWIRASDLCLQYAERENSLIDT